MRTKKANDYRVENMLNMMRNSRNVYGEKTRRGQDQTRGKRGSRTGRLGGIGLHACPAGMLQSRAPDVAGDSTRTSNERIGDPWNGFGADLQHAVASPCAWQSLRPKRSG
jgi:hypothetical protein